MDTRALTLKAGILRQLRRGREAERAASIALKIDPLDFRAMNELRLAHSLEGNVKATDSAAKRMTPSALQLPPPKVPSPVRIWRVVPAEMSWANSSWP